MDWNAVADAIEVTLDSLPGLNSFSEVPDSLPTVGVYVGEMDIDLDVTMRRRSVGGRQGTDQATITIRLLVARYDDKAALRKLRTYMSSDSNPESVIDALAANRTLNGTVHDSQPKTMRGNRLFQVGEMRYYGVEIDLFVIGDAG